MALDRCVILIEGAAHGAPTPYDQRFLQSFDPEAHNGRGEIWTTNDLDHAMTFANKTEAMELWTTQSKTMPLRAHDGKPNKPLTAFTITVDTVAHFMLAPPHPRPKGEGFVVERHMQHFIERVAKRQDWMFYVCLPLRLGASAVCWAIEYTLFEPKSPENVYFELDSIFWGGMNWYVVSCPAHYHERIQQIAKTMKMRIANGVPRMLGDFPKGPGVSDFGDGLGGMSFPGAIEGEKNMWTIENDGTPTLSSDTVRKRGLDLITILEAGARPTVEEMSAMIWGKS